MTVTTTELAPDVGVEIAGLTGADLVDPQVVESCRAALKRYGVVVYREVGITDEQLVAASGMLGEVVVPARGGVAGLPEVQVISLDPAKSALARYQDGTFHWHIDGTTDAVPQKGTLLTALDVSDEGGDTEFANTYAAYEALPVHEKSRIANLRVVHSFAAAQLRSTPNPSEKLRAAWAQVPAREHPLVWTRRDGRRSLLIGATAGEVIGMPPDEGTALLDHLLEWATQPRFVLRHHWRPGDLVVWDNTGMLHRAISYEVTSRRLLHRTTLVGEEGVA